MKKYFITSDIHSFYYPLKLALDKAGFNIDNPEHIFVCCGDIFDRGEETKEVYKFIKSLPENRRILIRGNHEILYTQLLKKGFPDSYDYSNGTVKTFCAIANFDEKVMSQNYWYELAILEHQDTDLFADRIYDCWRQIKECVSMSPITSWIKSDEWRNYWETEHYIFVHSFIPIHEPVTFKWGQAWAIGPRSYREDWKNATLTEWEDATWGCPWKQAKEGLNKTGKTIICGHWHTADFFNNLKKLKKKYDATKENPIFESKKYHIIGLDACTVATDRVNVLVLNEDEL